MSIQDQLYLWGKGKRVNHAPNGYPSQAAFAKEMGQGNIGTPPLLDDEHCRIDRAVSQLKTRKEDHYRVIVKSYIYKLTDHEIAEGEKTSRDTIRRRRRQAEYYVDGAVNAIDCPEDFATPV